MHNSYTWKAAFINKESNDALSISFDTGSDNFIFKPGQFVNLTLLIDGNSITRSYSLTSIPGGAEKPAITVKKVEGGILSNYILKNAGEIKYWNISGPHGAFYANTELRDQENIVLIGGGSGITPLYSILKYLLTYTHAKITLIDCNKTWEDVIFKNDLNLLEQTYPERFSVWHFLSRSSSDESIVFKNFRREKLTKLVLKKLLKSALGSHLIKADFFICGPLGLMQLAHDCLTFIGIESAKIHMEYFVAPEHDSIIQYPETIMSVLLHYYNLSYLIDVKPGNTILESALEEKIPLNYSCKNGTCGICIGKHTSGQLQMKKNYALTEDQVKAGYRLLCQSYPVNDNVTVVIE